MEIAEHLSAMSETIFRETGQCGVRRLVVSVELGLRLGLPPGTTMKVSTVGGDVEIQSEQEIQLRPIMW